MSIRSLGQVLPKPNFADAHSYAIYGIGTTISGTLTIVCPGNAHISDKIGYTAYIISKSNVLYLCGMFILTKLYSTQLCYPYDYNIYLTVYYSKGSILLMIVVFEISLYDPKDSYWPYLAGEYGLASIMSVCI